MTGFLKKAGLGAIAAATLIAGTAPAADAQRYYGGYHGYYHRGGIGAGGAAVLGGLVGLGIGAAIASDHPRYYGAPGYYYGPGPAPRGYYYDGYYAPRCWTQFRWDPYYGHRVPVRVCD